MPVTMHGGWSSPIGGCKTDLDVAAWIIGHVEVVTGGPYTVTQLILSGVLDRIPKLRFIVQEAGAGWLPFSMDIMDHFYDRQRFWAGLVDLEESTVVVLHQWQFPVEHHLRQDRRQDA